MNNNNVTRRPAPSDSGTILPMVLVATIVFTLIVGAVAGLVTTGLRYGRVVEERADRLAAADGGLRYGIERLRNFDDELCTTKLGTGGGHVELFPPTINGAKTTVTCRRTGSAIADGQGFGLIITGDGVPSGQPMLTVQGAASSDKKKVQGPVFIADIGRVNLSADLIIDQGDLIHTILPSCPEVPVAISSRLKFEPSVYRGASCRAFEWEDLFGAPTYKTPTAPALAVPAPFNDIIFPGCRVFYPGKYSGTIPLLPHNYFVAGDYYFENVPFVLKDTDATFGFPSGSGDNDKVDTPECDDAMVYDQNTSGERGGGTIWLGGSSRIEVGTGGELEIFRRQQYERYMSVFAVKENGAGFTPSTNRYGPSPFDFVLETKEGNTNDVAIHGWFWAPYAKMKLGNVTNAVVGQLVGGLTIASLDAQASASANEFAIGLEGTPIEAEFILDATAVKDGRSTTIQAIVQFRPDPPRPLAVKSWRVLD